MELTAKADSADTVKNSISNHEAKIKELELQIQKCVAEKNDLEIKFEEAQQDLGIIRLIITLLYLLFEMALKIRFCSREKRY